MIRPLCVERRSRAKLRCFLPSAKEGEILAFVTFLAYSCTPHQPSFDIEHALLPLEQNLNFVQRKTLGNVEDRAEFPKLYTKFRSILHISCSFPLYKMTILFQCPSFSV